MQRGFNLGVAADQKDQLDVYEQSEASTSEATSSSKVAGNRRRHTVGSGSDMQ